jgi:thiol-disulfide isomerase/thioredoxin
MARASGGLALALVAALAGCSRPGADRAPVADRAHADGPPVVAASAVDIQRLAARPGARGTLVNVWATWCAPCREEFPTLLEVARAHERAGLRLVLVSADFDDQVPAVRAFLAERGVTDTTYIKSGDDMPFVNTLNPEWSGALPATFIYDGGGRLVEFWEGMADEARFLRSVNQVLAARNSEREPRP